MFVGDAELKTEEKFVRFEEHEDMAKRFHGWRLRGVVCMSLARFTPLHRFLRSRYFESKPDAREDGGDPGKDNKGCPTPDRGNSRQTCRVRPVGETSIVVMKHLVR